VKIILNIEYFFLMIALIVLKTKLAIMKVKANDVWRLPLRSLIFSLTLLFIFSFSASVQAQSGTVKGKVFDINARPLGGVSVTEKDHTGKGTVTDSSGAFSLPDVSLSSTLLFSYVGFESQEVKVGKENSMYVTMRVLSNSLNDVVVLGYGTTSRKNLTTAISTINPKNVPQAANSSVSQLFFGRAAGVQATQQSAEPGGNIILSVRGRPDPLIVVDGVVMPYQGLEPGNGVPNNPIGGEMNGVHRGGFAGLNPNDIESIEILKDASASIYGVNAANGVILITTKKGAAGRMSINFNGNESYVQNMQYFQPLNPTDYMTYYNQLALDQYLITNKMAPFGPNPASGYVPKYSDQQIQSAGSGTNWLDQVLQNGRIDNYDLSINGGSDRVTYYLSGGYFNQIGTVKNSGMQKYTGKMNVSAKLTDFMTFNAGLNAAQSNFLNSNAGWQTGGSGSQGFGSVQAAMQYPSIYPIKDSAGAWYIPQNYTTGNPVSLLTVQDQTYYTALLTNLSLDFTIIPKVLTAKVLYGNNGEKATRNFYIPSDVFYFQQLLSRGSYTEAQRQYQTMEANVTYTNTFAHDKLNLTAVGGVGRYIYSDYGFTSQASGMLDAIGTSNLSSGNQSSFGVYSYKDYTQTRSYYGRASFAYVDKYILSFSYRYDGYNNFFPDNKYAGFPAISGAWKISNEGFLKNATSVNLLKLRASYGVTGTLPTPAAVAYGTFSPDGTKISFDNGATSYVAYYQTALDQPGLQWPKTVNSDIGLDFSFYQNRIAGSLDWFRDDLTRILNTSAITAPLSIITTAPTNGGHQVRQGYEISLNTVNIQSRDFQWTSVINVSHVSYRWQTRFPNAFIPPGAKTTDPVNAIYAYPTNGILQIGQAPPAYQPASESLPGSPIFVDVNGNKQLDSGDIKEYNVDPTILIGFGNTFHYKNWDLLLFLYGQVGGKAYNTNTAWQTPANILAGSAGVQETKNAWSTTNQKGTLPGVSYNEAALGLLAPSDVGLTKTDFLRMRNITLGYKLTPTKYFKSLRIYLDIQNAFIITKYPIGDPEILNVAVKGGGAPYPMARTYSIGFQAGF
jgi:TonB-linked SusC/RagA family outer membrane protein